MPNKQENLENRTFDELNQDKSIEINIEDMSKDIPNFDLDKEVSRVEGEMAKIEHELQNLQSEDGLEIVSEMRSILRNIKFSNNTALVKGMMEQIKRLQKEARNELIKSIEKSDKEKKEIEDIQEDIKTLLAKMDELDRLKEINENAELKKEIEVMRGLSIAEIAENKDDIKEKIKEAKIVLGYEEKEKNFGDRVKDVLKKMIPVIFINKNNRKEAIRENEPKDVEKTNIKDGIKKGEKGVQEEKDREKDEKKEMQDKGENRKENKEVNGVSQVKESEYIDNQVIVGIVKNLAEKGDVILVEQVLQKYENNLKISDYAGILGKDEQQAQKLGINKLKGEIKTRAMKNKINKTVNGKGNIKLHRPLESKENHKMEPQAQLKIDMERTLELKNPNENN